MLKEWNETGLPPEQQVAGSNPARRTIPLFHNHVEASGFPYQAVDCQQEEVQRGSLGSETATQIRLDWSAPSPPQAQKVEP
jgi:hypothetical protein